MRISDWSSYVCSSDLAVSAFAVVLILFGIDTDEQRFRELVGFAEDHIFDALGRVRIVAKEFFRVLLALTDADRSEEHTSELQSLMRISYAVFCLKKKQQI